MTIPVCGMLKALKTISEAQKTSSISKPIIVDLHPDRSESRGFMIGNNPVSLPADPTFADIEI
ncbi:hypothetical protein LARI1_G008513 [Lachnellula arida]|uniref:Uncharacterized protein n=1 Tax=Lachnellula arida TaxID=1316785 RepID=A0A8T9AZB5_9HELO|nr:hypothetical protein LARI1_G008513 [Lachnellula arida]